MDVCAGQWPTDRKARKTISKASFAPSLAQNDHETIAQDILNVPPTYYKGIYSFIGSTTWQTTVLHLEDDSF